MAFKNIVFDNGMEIIKKIKYTIRAINPILYVSCLKCLSILVKQWFLITC